TRGLFIGEKRAYLSAQVDDLFRASALYGGGTYRINGDELRRLGAWQRAQRGQPATAGLRIAFAFNGQGASTNPDDDLMAAARELGREVEWINHTYSHLALNDAAYSVAY